MLGNLEAQARKECAQKIFTRRKAAEDRLVCIGQEAESMVFARSEERKVRGEIRDRGNLKVAK